MEDVLLELMTAIVALIMALIAYLKSKTAKQAEEEKAEIVDFFTDEHASAEVVSKVPERSWRMNDATREWILYGESAADQEKLNEQINKAEAAEKRRYEITYSKGGYEISYGLIRRAWKGEP